MNDHRNDVIMGAIASQITSVTIVYSTVYPDADQKSNSTKLQVFRCIIKQKMKFEKETFDGNIIHLHKWPLLLTWFNFNPSMDK